MSRTLPLAVIAALLLIVSACSSGTTSTAAPSSAPAASAPAASDGGGAGEAACTPSTETGTVTATIADFAFSPATITAKVGDVITWQNDDSAGHTATLTSDAACTTPTIAAGSSGSLQFNVAGSYDYFCKIHPTMTGKIEVS
jgi:plastocyanin